MTKPIRIQRKRTKGWKMPENTVSVTRPGKWGNPFKVGTPQSVGPNSSGLTINFKLQPHHCIDLFRTALLNNELPFSVADLKRDLKGKNLACWCKEGEPCHADVLLELANK